jgi:DNA-binding NarL/FixJ family response regulator
MDITAALLEQFDSLVGDEPRTRLRSASGHLMLSILEGGLEEPVRQAVPYLELCDHTSDAWTTSSFLYRLAYSQVLLGRYSEGLRLVGRAEDEVRLSRLVFATTHIAAVRVAVTIGVRKLGHAQQLIDKLIALTTKLNDTFEYMNARGLQARVYLAGGRAEDAAEELRLWEDAPTRSLRAEFAALRSLACAVGFELDEAERLAHIALTTSRDVVAQTFARAAQSVIDLQKGIPAESSRVSALASSLAERQNYDSFVCAYRAYPALLPALAESPQVSHARVSQLVTEARDQRLAGSVGFVVRREPRVGTQLSPRESEVLDLICRGLTNKEIAARLVISEVTVKVHVRHILEKLGVRSRAEAAARAQDLHS